MGKEIKTIAEIKRRSEVGGRGAKERGREREREGERERESVRECEREHERVMSKKALETKPT